MIAGYAQLKSYPITQTLMWMNEAVLWEDKVECRHKILKGQQFIQSER